MDRFPLRLQARGMALAGVLLGILGLVAGLVRGEALTLVQKAARICLECIGLG